MYSVLIRGLEFYAHHGVPPEERVIGHRYRADLEIEVDGGADETDDIAETVDYGVVASTVLAVSQAHRYHTVERLARMICEQLLKEHRAIQRVAITLVKPLPPAPIIAAETGVSMRMSR